MKAALRGVLVLIAAATLVHAGPASAGDSPGLGGYKGVAASSGLHIFYNPEGVLPTSAPVDVGAPDAYATIASGPATFARGSVVDPGDLLANPDALLALGVSGWKSGTLPAYPYRVTASSGSGAPSNESAPAPGLNARVSADPTGSSATSTMPAGVTPALATFGSMTATSTTATDGTTVTVHARSEISNLNVLGVLTIDSIVTDLVATSDGTTTPMAGGTTIGGAKVLGLPVAIDAGGVHDISGDGPTTTAGLLDGLLGSITGPLVGDLNTVLAAAGIHVTVGDAAPVTGGTSGQIGAEGLRIDLDLSETTFPALKTILDAVPYVPPLAPGAPSVSDIVKLARARHLVAIELGRSFVSLTARPTRPAAPFVAATPTAPTPAGSSASPATGTGSTFTPAAPSLAPAGAAPIARAATDATPDVPVGAGIGALALLALLAQPFIGERLAFASQAVLGADQLTSCPWEEQ